MSHYVIARLESQESDETGDALRLDPAFLPEVAL